MGSLAAVPCRSRHEGGAHETPPRRQSLTASSPFFSATEVHALSFKLLRHHPCTVRLRIAASPYRPSPAFNPSFDSDSRVCLRRTRGYATSFVVNRPRGRFSFDCSSNSSHGLASSCKSIRYRSPSHLVHTPRFRISFKYIIQNTTSMRDTPNDRTVHESKKKSSCD